MRIATLWFLAAFLIAVAAASVGCGSSGADHTTTVTALAPRDTNRASETGSASPAEVASCLQGKGFRDVSSNEGGHPAAQGAAPRGRSVIVVALPNDGTVAASIVQRARQQPRYDAQLTANGENAIIASPRNQHAMSVADDCVTAEGSNGAVDRNTSDAGKANPSRIQVIRAADRICRKGNSKIDELSTDSIDQLADGATLARTVISTGISELEDLRAAPSMKLKLDQYIGALRNQNDLIQQLIEAARSRNVAAVRALMPELERARDRKSEIAIRAGFAECGSG